MRYEEFLSKGRAYWASLAMGCGMDVDSNTTPLDIYNFCLYPTYSVSKERFQLLDYQKGHANRLYNVLHHWDRGVDESGMGTGKTIVACWLARKCGLPLVVFCPKPSIKMWHDVAAKIGNNVVSITNYEMIRSNSSGKSDVKWYDMRHGWVDTATQCPWVSKEVVLKGEGSEIKYYWKLPYKCFIVLDEGHVAKNTGTQTFNVIDGLMSAAKKNSSKVLYLSGTPIEKDVNIKTLMYLIGLISMPTMPAVNSYFSSRISNIKDMKQIHTYLCDVSEDVNVRPTGRVSFMLPQEKPDGITNEILPMSFSMQDRLDEIKMHNREIMAAREKLRLKQMDGALGIINRNRQFIETLKINEVVRIATTAMFSELWHNGRDFGQFKRVAIFVNFKQTIRVVKQMLSEMGVPQEMIAEFHGDAKQVSEVHPLDRYRSGEAPILLATIKKGGTSISLHDTSPGGQLRTLVIILPPVSATDLLQTTGRHNRTGMTSSVTQIIPFAEGDEIEESIRRALDEKTSDITTFTTGIDKSFDLYDLVRV